MASFRRVDLEGQPEIDALVENVSETNRSTTLSKGNVKLHTVEHVLAAFSGFGIDNAWWSSMPMSRPSPMAVPRSTAR